VVRSMDLDACTAYFTMWLEDICVAVTQLDFGKRWDLNQKLLSLEDQGPKSLRVRFFNKV